MSFCCCIQTSSSSDSEKVDIPILLNTVQSPQRRADNREHIQAVNGVKKQEAVTNNNSDGTVPVSVQNIKLEEAHQQCEVEIQQVS